MEGCGRGRTGVASDNEEEDKDGHELCRWRMTAVLQLAPGSKAAANIILEIE